LDVELSAESKRALRDENSLKTFHTEQREQRTEGRGREKGRERGRKGASGSESMVNIFLMANKKRNNTSSRIGAGSGMPFCASSKKILRGVGKNCSVAADQLCWLESGQGG
jgi:hypothetical protein